MNTKALRQKVLDLAIHGKLVPQNPNDESATVLLEKIRAEKAEKIKKGELKADKKDSFIFVGSDKRHYEQFADGTVKDIEDEIPFNVPEGWAWCRLGEIGNIVTGSTPSKTHSEYYGNEYPFFKPTDLEQGINTIIAEDNLSKIGFLQARQLPKNSILVTCIGATIGKTGLIKTEGTCNQQINAIIPNNSILPIFLFFSCLSDFMQESIISNSSSTTLPILNKSKFASLLLPLPPIEEQSRIIDTLKIIFAQIMTVEQNKSDLKLLIKHAKSKILDLAIHGKLIPQDPADEPAEELLKRIATSDNRPYKKFDDEEPFDIPESWSWCTLGEIYTHTTGKALKKTNNKGTLRKYITTSNLYWNSFDFTEVREMYFTDDELEKCTIKKGDLILCNGGDVGRAAIWNYDYDICYQNHVSRLRPKNEKINNSFLKCAI